MKNTVEEKKKDSKTVKLFGINTDFSINSYLWNLKIEQ